MPTIRFLRSNKFGRKVGTTDSEMTPGVQTTLVECGFAEFVEAEEQRSDFEFSPSAENPDNHRGRKRRSPKETFE